MYFTKYRYFFLFFIVFGCQQVFGQLRAEYSVSQSQSNDTLYLNFEIRRTSSGSYNLGGYNIVFNIDPTVLDTNSVKIVSEGDFGSVSGNYYPLELRHIRPSIYSLNLIPLLSGTGRALPNAAPAKAGRVAFVTRGCGSSGIAWRTTQPLSAIISWDGDPVDESALPISLFNVNAKLSPKATLVLSEDTVCANTTIRITAQSNTKFSNYKLIFQKPDLSTTLVAGPQASNIFSTTVTETGAYFVTFLNGTCPEDTTETKKVVVSGAPATPNILPNATTACLGEKVTYSISPANTTSTYLWTLEPSGTTATIAPAGAIAQVSFNGTSPYSVNVKVQETNKTGCVGTPKSITVGVTGCSFNADFIIKGSVTPATTCKGTKVTFEDNSKFGGNITIKSWFWDFGPGAVPDTSHQKNPPAVTYNASGIANVRLVVTNNLGQSDTVTKSPTVQVQASLTEKPTPTCGSSSCSEVNFNWGPVQGATQYKVSYKKNKNGTFTPFQNVGAALTFKVTDAMVGGLGFSDTKNDTVFIRVKAIAGVCDSVQSDIVFCRPSYCTTTDPGCVLPAFSIVPPAPACKGTTTSIKVNVTLAKDIAISWNNSGFTTATSYNAFVSDDLSQDVTFLLIDTTKTNCYSLNTISIPVTPKLTTKPDLGIQSLECDRVTFVWKHVAGAAYYEIKYSGSCISPSDWVKAPLDGQAEFYELQGLTNGCSNINFQVRARNACNMTQSDTLISPPTCTCYIGHIASSSLRSCAFDTSTFKVTNIQIPNWLIAWKTPGSSTFSTPGRDSVFRYVPQTSNTINTIAYRLINPNDPTCTTEGIIMDTLSAPGNATWDPLKKVFCLSDALYYFDGTQVKEPGHTFLGNGIREIDDKFYFDASLAGLGTHTISYNACGNVSSKTVTVVSVPCVSTVVDGGDLADPQGLYTACDGTIYITDRSSLSLYRYTPGAPFGKPELLVRSPSSSVNDMDGNIALAKFGQPVGIVLDESTGNEIYFTDYTKSKVKRLVLDKQKIETVVGSIQGDEPTASVPNLPLAAGLLRRPFSLAIHPNMDTIYVSDEFNLNVKGFTFKGINQRIMLKIGGGGDPLPTRGKLASLTNPLNIAVDSVGLYGTDKTDNFLYRYNFKSDSAFQVSQTTINGYADGTPGTYRVRSVYGVSSKVGDWIYFTDQANFALRRIDLRTGQMETVAGSKPPIRANTPAGANGLPFDARFSKPGPISFNIKGYIDILDAGPPAAVRRYYLPRWGVSTWDGLDTVYIANCDRDTLNPLYSGGRFRVIQGKTNAILPGDVFAPKDTGTYLLGYTMKIGRCDTTFTKSVRVNLPPKSELQGDTVCTPTALLVAKSQRDPSLRYEWFGPNDKELSIITPDSNRTLTVRKSGKYYVRIYYGKAKQCFLTDSAIVSINPAVAGRVIVTTTPLTNGINYPTADSVQLCYGGTTGLGMRELVAAQPRFKKFLWNTGDTTRNITSRGSGNYVVKARDSTGCDITARYRVINQPLPNVCLQVTDLATNTDLGWGKYTVSTFAGSGAAGGTDGVGKAATFDKPFGLALYNDTLYTTDFNGHTVRAISIKNGNVRTILGQYGDDLVVKDSTNALDARLSNPTGIALDAKGDLFVVNSGRNSIYKYDKARKLFFNFAGRGGKGDVDDTAKKAMFYDPKDLLIDPIGNLYVADYSNNKIRVIYPNRVVRTFAGTGSPAGVDGKGINASFHWPFGLGLTPSGKMFISDEGLHTLRTLDLDTNVSLYGSNFAAGVGNNGNTFYAPIAGASARFNKPWNFASDFSGNMMFTDAGNNQIRFLSANGRVITVAGLLAGGAPKDGAGDSARFNGPTGIVKDPLTGDYFIADQNNNVIRRMARNKVVYVCRGSYYKLGDSCNTGVTWQKRTASGLRNLSVVDLIQGFNDTATYIATIRSTLGSVSCGAVKDSVIIKWHKPSTAKLSVVETITGTKIYTGCLNDSIPLAATSGYRKYMWFVKEAGVYTNLDTTLASNIKLRFNNPSLDPVEFYSLGTFAVNPVTGCVDTSDNVNAVLYKAPKTTFKDTLTCFGNSTLFTPLEVDNSLYYYRWDFRDTASGALNTSFEATPSHVFTKSGVFKVKLYGASNFSIGNGITCADSTERDVKIATSPQVAFTINGQVGDTIRFCSAANSVLNIEANVIPDPLSTGGPFTYRWFETPPADGKLDVSSVTKNTTARPTARASELSSLFMYHVEVADPNGCSNVDTAFARLSAPPRFFLTLSPSTKICRGQSVTFTTHDNDSVFYNKSDYSYVWDSAGVQVADTNVFTTKPSTSIAYKLTVTNKITGCDTVLTTPVIEVSAITVSIQAVPPPTPCVPADSVPILAQVSGTPVIPYQEIRWTDSTTGLPPTTIINPTNLLVRAWRDTVNHVYKVFVKDAVGCIDSGFVRVRGASSPTPPVFRVLQGRDTGICANGTVRLGLQVGKGQPPFSFTWLNEDNQQATEVNLTDTLRPVVTAIPGKSVRKYKVLMQDVDKCFTVEDSVKLTVYDMSLLLNTGNKLLLCRSSSDPNPSTNLIVTPTDIPSVTSPSYLFSWTESATGQELSVDNSLENITTAGRYVVKVTNTATACVKRDSAYVGILNEPEQLAVNLAGPAPTCNNKPILLHASIAPPGKAKEDSITFKWTVNGGLNFITSFDSSVVYLPNPLDTGNISFTVDAENRCRKTSSASPVFRLVAGARADLQASVTETFVNREVIFTNRSINSDSVNVLTIEDGTITNLGVGLGETFSHSFKNEGKFKAILYASNANNCPSRDTVLITVIDKLNIFIPNVFSPSANSEENRYLRLYGVNISSQEFSLSVYNRWGQLVYTTGDLTKAMYEGWDGKDNGGDAQLGVYTYILRGKFTNGTVFEKTGTVTLLR